jgi:hypothetical protein
MADYIERDGAISVVSYCECYRAVRALEELPAADVEPVVHSHWIYKVDYSAGSDDDFCCPSYYECARCGRTTKDSEPYCHCGAKMDEKEEESHG